MKNIKFVVKVNRGTRATQYVHRVDRTPIQMTPNRKLALIMGRFTAEDAMVIVGTVIDDTRIFSRAAALAARPRGGG